MSLFSITDVKQAAIKRAKIYAPYADLLWVETSTPNLSTARHISGSVRDAFPGKWFVYNLSPSFNWAKFGFTGGFCLSKKLRESSRIKTTLRIDNDLKNLVWDLAKEGFVFQLISLAGLHCDAVSWGMHSFPQVTTTDDHPY